MAEVRNSSSDTVAFGPGPWDQLPTRLDIPSSRNAPTWLDEMQAPAALDFDVSMLRRPRTSPASHSRDQSPPMFGLIH